MLLLGMASAILDQNCYANIALLYMLPPAPLQRHQHARIPCFMNCIF